ncbi:MAG TPA: alpha-amylase family protein, partial [Egibacteraceae bacterium]|nr:alpha-amylase family protein [Egibacteraceae bacterium]
MSTKATSDLWWKNAVIYCLDVETFMDHDGDGCGDFAGLTERVDYLAGLGVTCIWLMPFYPTPDLDDGYDIREYCGVDPRLGSLGDFVEFVRTASDRGMRVIADLIVNHTSDQHPWFQQARKDPDSPLRDYYVWVDEPPDDGPDDLVFPDAEDSNWEYDEQAGQYYLHRFYGHQPDLNVGNPDVRDEIHKVIGFWLELGLSGFRIDAVPFFLEDIGIEHDVRDDPHDYLRDLRAFTSRRRGDAMLLGEVNLEPGDLRQYFGGDHANELHMLFNFVVNQALYLALVREDPEPIRGALRALPQIPEPAQWANFVRNHDELSLDKLTDDEREEVFAQLAPDEGMRLFGRGIRRRLPTMLGGDRRRIELTYSLLFSLPGTPVLFYGEEIGMGENLDVDGRMAVRTPMQWSDEPNGGFSSAPADQLCVPMTEQGDFGYRQVNVDEQRRDEGSLLNWMERMIRLRKLTPEIGWGA